METSWHDAESWCVSPAEHLFLVALKTDVQQHIKHILYLGSQRIAWRRLNFMFDFAQGY